MDTQIEQDRVPATEAEHELALALNLADTYKRNAQKANSALSHAVEGHENFKQAIVKTAMSYAKEHNWCGVVKEALREMGLEVPPTKFRATVTVTHYVDVEVEDGEDFDESDMSYAIDGARLDLSKEGVDFNVYDSETSVDYVEAVDDDAY